MDQPDVLQHAPLGRLRIFVQKEPAVTRRLSWLYGPPQKVNANDYIVVAPNFYCVCDVLVNDGRLQIYIRLLN